MKVTYYLIILIISICSCQSAKELHYFKQGDNYYRIKINECAFLSSSRYQSGYYDEAALDQYFGEIRRPDTSGNFLKFQVDSSGKFKAAPSNTKLVMILSTKSEIISDQISAFAENEQTLEMIARLSNKDAITKNKEIKNDIQIKSKQVQSLSDYGDLTIMKIDNTLTKEETKTKILLFLNQLAAHEGRKQPFSELKEAYNWYLESF